MESRFCLEPVVLIVRLKCHSGERAAGGLEALGPPPVCWVWRHWIPSASHQGTIPVANTLHQSWAFIACKSETSGLHPGSRLDRNPCLPWIQLGAPSAAQVIPQARSPVTFRIVPFESYCVLQLHPLCMDHHYALSFLLE